MDPRQPWQAFGALPGFAPDSPSGSAASAATARVQTAAQTLLTAADAAAAFEAARALADALRDLFAGNPFASKPPGNSAALLPPDLALGPTREHQLRWQRLGAAALQVEDAACRLQRLWGDVLREAAASFVTRAGGAAAALPAAARAATPDAAALRRLYDAWIDCAEEAYSRTAHGAAFCDALADAVNAGSRWRRELKAIGESAAALLDLPTRSELDALHRRLTEVESQLREARAAQVPAATGRLGRGPEPAVRPASDAAPGRPTGCSDKDIVWRRGKLVLYRYRSIAKPTVSTPVLIVYALVNRPYMLDLQPDRSIIRGLLAAGLDVYLIDWGYPDGADRHTSLADYLEQQLADCVDHILQRHSLERLTLLGVCQGGVFSLCYAALHPEQVQNLVTMVTPVDFRTPADLLSKWVAKIDVDAWLDGGNAAGDALNQVFLWLMPFRLMHQKYVDLMAGGRGREGVEDFMRVERWIFDSPDQAGAAFSEFLRNFHQENRLADNRLEIGGKPVDLGRLRMPILNLIGTRDHLVPPASSAALRGLVGSVDYTALEFDLGHIGMYLSARAQRDVPAAIAGWLKAR